MGKIQSKKRYLLAFLIGTLIFINGFVVTNIILSIQFNRISQFQDQTSFTIFEDKLNYRLFDIDICKIDNFNKIYPNFAIMFYRYGSEQIRNVASIGGNLASASPIGDFQEAVGRSRTQLA